MMKKTSLIALSSLILLAGCGPQNTNTVSVKTASGTTVTTTSNANVVVTNSSINSVASLASTSVAGTNAPLVAVSNPASWQTFDMKGVSVQYPSELSTFATGGQIILQTADKTDKSNDLMVINTQMPMPAGISFEQFFDQMANGLSDSYKAGNAVGGVVSKSDIEISGIKGKKIISNITKDGKTGEVTMILLPKDSNIYTINFLRMAGISAEKDYSKVVEEMIKTIKLK